MSFLVLGCFPQGLTTESELPVHYRRSVLQMDTQETYEDMLQNTVGFDNPFNVANLNAQLGINDARPVSLMRGLQRLDELLQPNCGICPN